MCSIGGSRQSLVARSGVDVSEIPLFGVYIANFSQEKNNIRWTVWLGRHPAEMVSVGPKGRLIPFRTRELSARAKAGLTVFLTIRNAEAKAGSSELLCPPWWGLGMTEKLSRA